MKKWIPHQEVTAGSVQYLLRLHVACRAFRDCVVVLFVLSHVVLSHSEESGRLVITSVHIVESRVKDVDPSANNMGSPTSPPNVSVTDCPTKVSQATQDTCRLVPGSCAPFI
jgi:hypothetical protein